MVMSQDGRVLFIKQKKNSIAFRWNGIEFEKEWNFEPKKKKHWVGK